jgi:hypothetical protein
VKDLDLGSRLRVNSWRLSPAIEMPLRAKWKFVRVRSHRIVMFGFATRIAPGSLITQFSPTWTSTLQSGGQVCAARRGAGAAHPLTTNETDSAPASVFVRMSTP